MTKVIVFEEKWNPEYFLTAENDGAIHLDGVDIETTLMIGKAGEDADITWLKHWVDFWEEHTRKMEERFGDGYVPVFDWKNVLEHYNITLIDIDDDKLKATEL